jgi:phage shock protein A
LEAFPERGILVAMGIFDRVGTVISSNFNALLDQLEDPKKSVDQTLDGMREQIRAARREVVSAVAAGKQLEKRIEELGREGEKWRSRAELAVRAGDDDLAREALVHQRRVERERDQAEALRGQQRASALDMKSELERMEQRVTELDAKKGTLAAKLGQAKAGGGPEALGARGPGPTAFDEFRRMEDQIEAVETAAQAQSELDEAMGGRGPGGLTPSEVEAKFRALERGEVAPGEPAGRPDVEAELNALKKRIRIG